MEVYILTGFTSVLFQLFSYQLFLNISEKTQGLIKILVRKLFFFFQGTQDVTSKELLVNYFFLLPVMIV